MSYIYICTTGDGVGLAAVAGAVVGSMLHGSLSAGQLIASSKHLNNSWISHCS